MEWGEAVQECPWRMPLDDGLVRCKPVGDICTQDNCAPMYLAALWMYVESQRASLELMQKLRDLYTEEDLDDEVKQ